MLGGDPYSCNTPIEQQGRSPTHDENGSHTYYTNTVKPH